MSSQLRLVKNIIGNEGLFSFTHKIIRSIFYTPVCILKIKNLNSRMKIENLVDFPFNKCGKILAPMQVKSEFLSLLKTIEENKPKTVLEIGTARGGSLFLFSRVADKDALIISIDLPGGLFGGGYPFWKIPLFKRFASERQKIFLIRKDSHSKKTLGKAKSILRERKVDFLFIDGDHTYGGVKKDFMLYSSLVKKGGIVALHDIAPHPKESGCEVDKFWKEIKKGYKHKEFVENWHQKWAGIGLIIYK